MYQLAKKFHIQGWLDWTWVAGLLHLAADSSRVDEKLTSVYIIHNIP
jgi:hypothetical protein